MTRRPYRVAGRRGRDERGQAGLEFVLVLPFVFIVIFLVAEATSILKTWMILENASREGARYAAVRKSQTDVVNRTIQTSDNILTAANITVVNAKGTPGTDTEVQISYTYTFQTPLVRFVNYVSRDTIPNTMQMTAHTHMRLE